MNRIDARKLPALSWLATVVGVAWLLAAWATTPAAAQDKCTVESGANIFTSATGLSAFACGNTTDAFGDGATALGSFAAAVGEESTSVGLGAGSFGVGGDNNTLIGARAGGSLAGHSNSALGWSAGSNTQGNANTAIGAVAGKNVVGNGNSALGNGAGADTQGELNAAVGFLSGTGVQGNRNSAFGTEAGVGVVGSDNVAIGTRAGALFDGANNPLPLEVNDTVALGNRAVAFADGAVAIGAGVEATREGQVAIGGADATYTLAGINSADSKAAQDATTYLVSSDANGNLATSSFTIQEMETSIAAVADLDGRIGTLENSIGDMNERIDLAFEGSAMAMAMAGAGLPADKNYALSVNWGTFAGENAFAGSGQARLNDHFIVHGGLGIGARTGTVGGRAGLTLAW